MSWRRLSIPPAQSQSRAVRTTGRQIYNWRVIARKPTVRCGARLSGAGHRPSRKRTAMPTLPQDLQKLTDAMDAADKAAEELSAALSDQDFFWRQIGRASCRERV